MSVIVKYSKISNNEGRHVNYYDVTVTHHTKDNPVDSLVE